MADEKKRSGQPRPASPQPWNEPWVSYRDLDGNSLMCPKSIYVSTVFPRLNQEAKQKLEEKAAKFPPERAKACMEWSEDRIRKGSSYLEEWLYLLDMERRRAKWHEEAKLKNGKTLDELLKEDQFDHVYIRAEVRRRQLQGEDKEDIYKWMVEYVKNRPIMPDGQTLDDGIRGNQYCEQETLRLRKAGCTDEEIYEYLVTV